ncbi:MAG: metallophosphoesterase [Chryseolinea sp.]
MKTLTLSLLLISTLISTLELNGQGQPATLTGYVFIDKNNNGVRDSNEIGVKGARVSNQSEIVTTDANGSYSIASSGSLGNLFVIQPEGYVVRGLFWRPIDQTSTYDFPLIASPKASTFTFIHASDTHLGDQSLPRFKKLKAIVDSLKPAFIIVTGDLVKDALRVPEKEASRLYELYKDQSSKFSVPVWNVPGNHEIFGIERHKSLVSESNPLYGKKMFRHYLGPDYYAFSYGGIQFIGLNSVDYDDLWYYGHIDSLQLTWLKKLIAATSIETPNITFNHIPFYSAGMSMGPYTDEEPGSSLISINGKKQWRHVVANAEDVIHAFNGYNFPIALGGHFHFEQKFTFETTSNKTEFHQTGAVVAPTSEGGFEMPSGIVLYTVANGKIIGRKFIAIR